MNDETPLSKSEQEWNWVMATRQAEFQKTVNKTVALALRNLVEEICNDLPEIWPDSSEEDRRTAYTVNVAAEYFRRALNRVAENLEKS